MKSYVLIIIGFALGLSACGNKEQSATPQAAAPAVASMATEAPAAKMKNYQYEGILRHMHSHADQLDILNDALADDDFEAAKLPARWLWRHETLAGVPDDWQQYMAGMRQAARDVEGATDIVAARAAATRIIENCQACHSAVGMNRDILEIQ